MDTKQAQKELFTAIQDGDVERMVQVIEAENCLHMMTMFGSWLHLASRSGHLELVKRLVSMGLDVNRRSGIRGGNPLDMAASQGHLDVVKYLDPKGAELDVGDPQHNPLFGAIHGGHTEVARFLIDAGIDISVKYTGDYMKEMDALAFALEWGRSDIADLLRTAQSNVGSPPDNSGSWGQLTDS